MGCQFLLQTGSSKLRVQTRISCVSCIVGGFVPPKPLGKPFELSCCCSIIKSCPTLHDLMDCSTPGFPVLTISWSLPNFMSIASGKPSNHLILCCPLLLPSIFPSIRVFSHESAVYIRWPKYWSFSISPYNEYSRLISFKIDWFDLLAVQGTLKSLLLQHSLRHQFFSALPSL